MGQEIFSSCGGDPSGGIFPTDRGVQAAKIEAHNPLYCRTAQSPLKTSVAKWKK
jgi:hypothetical protein